MPREHVLIVEDDENIKHHIADNLSREGCRTTGALSGEDALKKIRGERFDVIVLDIMLPGIDGLDICKELKNDEKTRAIPVLMLTAKGEESDMVTGLELGADDYIVNPFST